MISVRFFMYGALLLSHVHLYGMAAEKSISTSTEAMSRQDNGWGETLGLQEIQQAPPLFGALLNKTADQIHEFVDTGINLNEVWNRTIHRGRHTYVYENQDAFNFAWDLFRTRQLCECSR